MPGTFANSCVSHKSHAGFPLVDACLPGAHGIQSLPGTPLALPGGQNLHTLSLTPGVPICPFVSFPSGQLLHG